ncbi:uncharacterized protein LOC130613242 [Hydractinia symbiolongicarpus]|uniref:uncharacterized protein LOC130613242 n=1 Tax=Hydractinia symbiolongicarpus TaxID=13093 RepID=UPI00254C339C|nr:uncharacterized protein LOC130613242 [Hydractinia symbiolongicarpus]
MIERLHFYLSSKNGTYLADLEQKFSQFENIKDILESRPDLFWLATYNENCIEVRAKLNVKLCYSYLNSTCGGDCGCLHICKDNLLSRKYCQNPCKFGFSHNLMDWHNWSLLSKYKGSNWELLLRSSFPRLCTSFSRSGQCEKLYCGYFHLCSDFVRDRCVGECKLANSCNQSKINLHNCGNKHNKKVLKNFDLSYLKGDRNVLLANILMKNDGAFNAATGPDLKSFYPRSTTNNTSENPIFICASYLKGDCRNPSCPRLHMCKGFLINGNKCATEDCRFGFSHDLRDGSNKKIINRHSLDSFSDWRLLEHIRSLFPRICKNYHNGTNCTSEQCNRIHICPEYCSDSCSAHNCKFSHDLRDEHNNNVLQTYNLHNIKEKGKFTEKQLILANVLYSKSRSKANRSSGTPSNEKLTLLMCKFYLDGNCKQKNCPRLHMCKEFLINGNKCVADNCKFGFSHDPLDSHNTFVMKKNGVDQLPSWVLLERVRKSFPRVCKDYLNGSCLGVTCRRLHICPNYCNNMCVDADCTLSHNLKDGHNMPILQFYSLDRIKGGTEKFILANVLISNYATQKNGEYCRGSSLSKNIIKSNLKLSKNGGSAFSSNSTLCKKNDFMKSSNSNSFKKNDSMKSSKSNLCSKIDLASSNSNLTGNVGSHKHESGVSGKQVKRLNLEENVVCNDSTVLKDHFNWLKEEGICSRYLVSECEAKSSCHLIHPFLKLPYLWQYKSEDNNEEWKSLPADVNMELEKKYCDPSSSSAEFGEIYVLFSPKCLWYGHYHTKDVSVRRLSTISSVETITEEAGATEWKWYWHSGGDTWIEYDTYTTSDDIERDYLSKALMHTFKTKEYKYELTFLLMEQKNLDEKVQTKREVRRRPVYKDRHLIRTKKTSLTLTPKLPAHWPKKFKPGERIPVDRSIYDSLERSLKASMTTNVHVINIEEICHEDHSDRYERKKKELTKKVPSVNERTLYHGTEYTVVNAICAQNFDWRLCGKNATVYGHGSYFSTSAEYSHSYTTPDMAGVHYMFIAEVLLGRFTTGNSTMKRPPLIPNSELEIYDSCVNKLANPSIFVVFDRDQCYPKYLISYTKSNVPSISTTDQTFASYFHGSFVGSWRSVQTTSSNNLVNPPSCVYQSNLYGFPSSFALSGHGMLPTNSSVNQTSGIPSADANFYPAIYDRD